MSALPVNVWPPPMPHVEQRTMNKGRTNEFERLFLFCPEGHDCGSVPVLSRHAKAWMRGDFSDWDCGFTSCDWTGDES